MHTLNEQYHIYNRGAHKAPIFLDKSDYQRFVALLYLANDTSRLVLAKIKPNDIFYRSRSPLVNIIVYCLMPNHFHILIREKNERGIHVFIHKLITAYTMYYNRKYDHSGTIFQGQYKSKHINDDDYFRYLIQYIHLNPYGIEEPEMNKLTKNEHYPEAVAYSKKYEFSSFKDYLGEQRAQANILSMVEVSPQPASLSRGDLD